MSTSAKRLAIVLFLMIAAAPRVALPAELKNDVDWEKFLARHDLVWNKLPAKWGEGAFTGNGLLGLMMYLTDDGKARLDSHKRSG